MDSSLRDSIAEWLGPRVDAFGFAPVDRFADAPEAHHPSRVCKGAQTVIVFGRTVPRGLLSSPGYNLHLLHRSYHTVYPYLDTVGMDLANLIESRGPLAVQIPSFAPLAYHGTEPWGILSLKHAAAAAGLGAFG
jgi:epoxyqueuosine reductase